jgi:chromosomal replication initiation ATPase DnaA
MIRSAYIAPGLKSIKYNENDLIRDVCEYYKVPIDKVTGKKQTGFRASNYVTPRQVSMYLIRKHFTLTKLEHIGNLFNRTHATVIHANKTISGLIEVESETLHRVNYLNKLIEEKISKSFQS